MWFLMLLGLTCAGCARFDRTAETRAVYAAILEDAYRGSARERVIAIGRQTFSHFEAQIIERMSVPPEWKPAVADFVERNERSLRVEDAFRVPHRMVANDDPTAQKRDERNLGLLVFSQVGFDVGGRNAFVYYYHLCGELCGHSTFVCLERTESGWRVVERVGTRVM